MTLFATLAYLFAEALVGMPPPSRTIGYDSIVTVAVGIGEYEDSSWEKLPNAVKDADEFAAVMAHYGSKTTTLKNHEATRSKITAAFENALKGNSSGPRTLFVFYFAGHGQEHYLIPYDGKPRESASKINMGLLKTVSRQRLGRARHQLFILGSCAAGSFLTAYRGGEPRKDLKRYLDEPALYVLAAGAAGVPDGKPREGSPFGRAVVRALTPPHGGKDAEADENRDGCVTQFELMSFVEGNTGGSGAIPQLGNFEASGGVIHLCRRELGKARSDESGSQHGPPEHPAPMRAGVHELSRHDVGTDPPPKSGVQERPDRTSWASPGDGEEAAAVHPNDITLQYPADPLRMLNETCEGSMRGRRIDRAEFELSCASNAPIRIQPLGDVRDQSYEHCMVEVVRKWVVQCPDGRRRRLSISEAPMPTSQ